MTRIDRHEEETRTAAGQAGNPKEPIAPAQRLGRYLVLSEVGRGAMGQVYAAYDPTLDRRVALKVLRGGDGPKERKRFLREAKALARISHPNVLTVHEVEEIGEQVVIALEFVSGGTLKDWLREHPPGGDERLREALELLVQAGKGLMAAHAEGLIHRDFKPSNVLVGHDGRVRVADFGLARRSVDVTQDEELDEARIRTGDVAVDPRVTQTGLVAGTPAYMAPEQWSGGELDARADQFSFCVVAWEVLFGERRFVTSHARGIEAELKEGPPKDLVESGVTDGIVAALRRGLAFRQGSRFAELRHVVEALELEVARLGGRIEERRGLAPWKLLGVAVLGATVYFTGHAANDWRLEQGCREEAARLDETWNPEVGQHIQASLRSTGLNFAPDVAEKITPWFQRKADAWKQLHTNVCVAARLRDEFTDDELSRARWCLEERRVEMAGLLELLVDPSTNTVANALQATASLRSVEPCGDTDLLNRLPVPPKTGTDEIQKVWGALNQAKLRREASEYEEAMNLAKAAREQATVVSWPPLSSAVDLEFGLLEADLYQLAEATKSLQTAFFTAQKAGALEEAFDAADALANVTGVQAAEFNDADLWLRHAEVALERLDGDPLRHSAFLRTKGLVERARGNYRDALETLTAARGVLQAELGQEHPGVGRTAMDVANLQLELGEKDLARAAYEQRLAQAKSVFGETHPDVAAVLSQLSEVEIRSGDYEEAEQYAARALEIYEVALGEHPAKSAALRSLADVYTRTERPRLAIETAKKSFDLEEEYRPVGHPALLSAAAMLGQAYRNNGQRDRALAAMTEAIRAAEERLGSGHPSLITPLIQLSGVYAGEGHREGLETAQRAKEIAEAKLSHSHPLVATATMEIGNAQFRAGDYAEAATAFREARRAYIAAFGPTNIRVADVADSLANTLSMQGKLDEAVLLRREALEIFKDTVGIESRPALRTLGNMAVTYSMQGESELALETLLQVLEIQRRILDPNDGQLATTLLNVGAEASTGEAHPELAMKHFKQALEIWKANGSPLRCAADVNIANTYRILRKPADSLIAANIAVDTCSSQPPKLAESQFVLARALAVNGKRRAALEMAKTARKAWKALGGEMQVAQIDEFVDTIDEFASKYGE